MFELRRQVYLDNNATTPVSKAVYRRMKRVLSREFGNPSSLYRAARGAALVLAEARASVARAVGAAAPEEITFTGSATEANNMALGAAFEALFPERKRIVTSPIEHASVMATLDYLRSRGAEIVVCPVDSAGRLAPADLAARVGPETLLVVVMLANNEIGTVQDVAAHAEIAHRAGALILADCVQALGKIPVDVRKLGVDYASFSAHKIHGPKGVGCLYARNGSPLAPFIHGGHQEMGRRAGTEGLHNIAGFAAACEEVPANLARAGEVARLRDQLAAELRTARGDIAVRSPADGLPNTLSVTFPGVSNALLMAGLDDGGVAVAAGSACNTQEDAPSHVLTAIGLAPEEARQTLRISLSAHTRPRDIRYAGRIFADCLSGKAAERIRVLTPAQLDENILEDPRIYILDVRFDIERALLKGLPHSHEVPFLQAKQYFHRLPRDKNILVVCQTGPNAPVVAYQLRRQHFRNVSVLVGGLMGWRLAHSELYRKRAGQGTVRLEI